MLVEEELLTMMYRLYLERWCLYFWTVVTFGQVQWVSGTGQCYLICRSELWMYGR